MSSEERCVCCGEIIPEGKQICGSCLAMVTGNRYEGRDVPMVPIRESMVIGYRYRCRRCREEVCYQDDVYCRKCGQKQNWSDNEWKS